MRGRHELWRRILLPLALTVVSVAVVAGTAAVATGSDLPAVSLQQSGHWALDQAAAAVFHIHGGTQKVDARVALPADAAQAGFLALQGEKDGYVVGSQRAWAFDKSTLAVDETVALPAATEKPVGVEVVGGPYLVYRDKGTVVRLGRPPAVLDAGGPVGMPVRTTDGTVWVHRADTGELCAARRGATEIDCTLAVDGGTPGGLTVTTDRATFVDSRVDAARQVRGTRLSVGAGLSSDLPDGVLPADQDTSARLPVVLPGENVLRLLDSAGIPTDQVAGDPVDIALGPGTFSSPLVSGEIVAVLELTTSRLLTFTAAGSKISDIPLAPGTGAEALVRGEDGRLYVDDAGGGQVRIVRPDGTVGSVGLGGGTGPGVATAPPTEQLQSVTPPPVGRVQVPVPSEDVRAAAPEVTPDLPGGPVITAPGVVGSGPRVPDPAGPVVPAPGPGPVAPVTPPEPEVPGVPTGVTAQLTGQDAVTVSWAPGGGGAATSYAVTGSGGVGTTNSTDTSASFTALAPGTYTFTVVARNDGGESGRSAMSGAVTVAEEGPPAPTILSAKRFDTGGGGYGIRLNWAPPTDEQQRVDLYKITIDGKGHSGDVDVQDISFDDDTGGLDNTNYCSPVVNYEIRAVSPGGAVSDPSRIRVDSAVNCTVGLTVNSATAAADGSVKVIVNCLTGGHGVLQMRPIQVLFDGAVQDDGSQTCNRRYDGVDLHTYTVGGLEPGTTYSVTARTTSETGPKTSAPVSVTTAG